MNYIRFSAITVGPAIAPAVPFGVDERGGWK